MRYILALCLSFSFNSAIARIVLTEKNHCYLDDQVSGETMSDLKTCLAEKAIKRGGAKTKIYLVLDSPGGSIYEGLRFIEFAKEFRDVETITLFAASMAAEIVQALPGKRHVSSTGVMMFHRAAGTFQGQFGEGEVEQQLKLWKTIVGQMEKTASKRIGITHKEYKKRVKDEWWVYGSENKKHNTADQVSSVVCSKELLLKTNKKSVNTIFGKFEWTVSACPMMN